MTKAMSLPVLVFLTITSLSSAKKVTEDDSLSDAGHDDQDKFLLQFNNTETAAVGPSSRQSRHKV